MTDRAGLTSLAEHRDGDAADLATLICGILAEVCDAADCGPDDDLAGLGVDSVRAAEAAAVLEAALALPVPLESILTARTPRAAADALVLTWAAEDREPGLVGDRIATAGNGASVL
jgi:acyl carrier protein